MHHSLDAHIFVGRQDLDPNHDIQYISNVATFFDSRKDRMKKSNVSKELLLNMRSYDYLHPGRAGKG